LVCGETYLDRSAASLDGRAAQPHAQADQGASKRGIGGAAGHASDKPAVAGAEMPAAASRRLCDLDQGTDIYIESCTRTIVQPIEWIVPSAALARNPQG